MSRNSFRAFTLIELLIVIAVIAILATIAYPAYTSVLERAKVTKDMNNLRQIGIATQLFMNDNDGVLPGSTTPTAVSWMSQLYPKYLSSWYVLISPFDNPVSPRIASDNNANSALSYGINGTAGVIGMSADKITKPTVFIVFAPAQASGTTVSFLGTADTTSQANLANTPNVTVVGNGTTATSIPGGTTAPPPPPQGTHANRTRINALFADWHCETMLWPVSALDVSPTFTHNAATTADPDGNLRWNPF